MLCPPRYWTCSIAFARSVIADLHSELELLRAFAPSGWASSSFRSAGHRTVYGVVYDQSQPAMSTTMTIRLDDDVKGRLDVLADATNAASPFSPEAIRAFVETNEWQIGEIQAALKEARRATSQATRTSLPWRRSGK